MPFYKEKNLTFRLKDDKVRMDFSIWKPWDKKTEEYKDASGNIMRFPIKDGVLTNEKGEIKEVADLKFMTNIDFKAQYPKYSRRFGYTRQLYINGVEYSYTFTKTANDKLTSKINDMKLMGKDPFKSEFKQVFDKSKQAVDMYAIEISAIDLPPVVLKQDTGITGNAPPIDKGLEVLEAIKNCGEVIDEARFMDIMGKNNIVVARALELYKEYKK